MASKPKAPAPIVAPEMAVFKTLGEGETPTKAGSALTHARADKRLAMLQKIPGGTPAAWARFIVDRLCDIDPAVRRAAYEWLRSRRDLLTLGEESAAVERLLALRAILTPDERLSYLQLRVAWRVSLRDEDLAWLAPMLDDPHAHFDARAALATLARTSDLALRALIDTVASATPFALTHGLDVLPPERLRSLLAPMLARVEALGVREAFRLLRALAPLGAESAAVRDGLRAVADAEPSLAPDALIALAGIDPQAVPELPERFDAWLAPGDIGRQSYAVSLAARRYPQWLLARAEVSPRTLNSLSDDEIAQLGPAVAAPLVALAQLDAYDHRAPSLLARVLAEAAVAPLVELLKPLSVGRFNTHTRYTDWLRVVEISRALRPFGARARGAAPLLLAVCHHNHDAVLPEYFEVFRTVCAMGEGAQLDAHLDETRARAETSKLSGAVHGAQVAITLMDIQRGPERLDARWSEVLGVLEDPFGLYRRWGYEALAPYLDQPRVREVLARAMTSDPASENQRCCAQMLGALA